MSKKQMKNTKKKLFKLKQKEITARNKELNKESQNKIELLSLNESGIPEIEDKIERSGPRGYVLKILKDMVDDMNSNDVEDKEIILVAKFLIKYATAPKSTYDELLKIANINLPKKKKNLINKSNANLNLTERVLLKNRMQGIIMEYTFNNLKTANIDYNGIRVFFETAYRLILIGLEDRRIKIIDTYLGYEDVLYDLIVEYSDSDNDSKYNINDNTYIHITWNHLDKLYNTYAIYKNKYKNFSEGSLKSLATADDLTNEYESRKNGKEIVSYSGIVLNYTCSLECELKSLISQKFNLNKKKLKLVDAINYLEKVNNPLLSDKKTIDALHEVRILRNRVAHGDQTTYDDYIYMRDLFLSSRILEYINEELANTYKNTKSQTFSYELINTNDLCFKSKQIKKEHEEVVKSVFIAANNGDAESQSILGALYDCGDIIKQDDEKAVEWYTKAAEQGFVDAQTLLAGMYLFNRGVNQDYEKAVELYTKAAEQGSATSQEYLGDMHYNGVGVKQDFKKAAKWYIKAAEQGVAEAQYKLGSAYGDGVGVKQDFEKAANWYKKAVAQEHVKSQVYLGVLYHNGYGVKQDFEESSRLFRMAAAHGDEEAKHLLDLLKK